jgi:hypothetical protein
MGILMLYEFKATSKEREGMTLDQMPLHTEREGMNPDHLCGVDAGPRTIFTIGASYAYQCYAYSIDKLSLFHGPKSEDEVFILALSKFKVKFAQRSIIDPKETTSPLKSGFPDSPEERVS